MPFMPCTNPDCSRYRNAQDKYCSKCNAELKQSAQQLIKQSMDNGVVKPLGELEDYNIYED